MAEPAARAGSPDHAGALVLSIDLELIWGVHDRPYRDEFIPVVRAARAALPRLVEALDRHRVPATWAVVGHLLDGCGDACREVERETAGYHGLPCRSGLDEALWRLPELPDLLAASEVEHDVAGHGFWHLELDPGASSGLFREEFGRSFRAVEAAFRRPVAYVYPRDRVVRPAELARAGFRVARTRPRGWAESLPGPARRAARFLGEALRTRPPEAALAPPDGEGPALLSASQQIRPLRGPWASLPSTTRLARARKGLERAAAGGGLYHLWFHPHDLVDDAGSADRGLELLGEILERAARLRAEGRLRTVTMAEAWEASGGDRPAAGEAAPGDSPG